MRVLLLVCVVACGSSEADPKKPDPKADPCSATALGLGAAKALTAWKPPAGCTAKPGASPAVIASDDEAKAYFDCKAGAKLGVDWKATALVVHSASWSPAQVGLAAFDDGKKVTLVNKDRSPCKGDPQPMPTPAITSLFATGPGARTFGQLSCTVPTKCQ